MRTFPRFPPRDDCYDFNPEAHVPSGSDLGSRSVFRDDETLGTLYVSRGALVWWSRSGKVGRKLSWDRFDDLLHQYGSRVRGS